MSSIQSAITRWGWRFNTLWDGIDPGDLRFRPQVAVVFGDTQGFLMRGWKRFFSGVRWIYVRSPANHRLASGTGVSDGTAAVEHAVVTALRQKSMQYLMLSRGSGRAKTEQINVSQHRRRSCLY